MIAIGCDHAGFHLKKEILRHLTQNGIKYKDIGCFTSDSVDYPSIAKDVADCILTRECELGILVCGTGVGMSMAANKIKGIRAAACSESYSTRLTRMHNNANILCIGARVLGAGVACDLVDIFLNTPFEGGRHQLRINKIAELER